MCEQKGTDQMCPNMLVNTILKFSILFKILTHLA